MYFSNHASFLQHLILKCPISPHWSHFLPRAGHHLSLAKWSSQPQLKQSLFLLLVPPLTSTTLLTCSELMLPPLAPSSTTVFTCPELLLAPIASICKLRGPAPKKRPIISGSKIELADFCLPSRGDRILFKNEFLLFQFCFKPKISSHKLFPSNSSKIRPKISPRKKNGSEITIATQNNKKTTHCLRKMPFNVISLDKHRNTVEVK